MVNFRFFCFQNSQFTIYRRVSCGHNFKLFYIRRRIENLTLISTIPEKSIMDILRVREDMIHHKKLPDIVTCLSIEHSICNLVEPSRKSHHITITKVKNISRWGMTIVDFSGSFRNILNGIKTIPRENHDIIFTQELCLLEKPILENCMTISLHKNRFPKWDHISSESEFPRIETSLTKKSRYKISIKCLRHQCHEPLPSSTIEEGIMENSNFWFL